MSGYRVPVRRKHEEHIYEYSLPSALPTSNGVLLKSPDFPDYLFHTKVFEAAEDGQRGTYVAQVPNFEGIIEITDRKLPQFLYRMSFDGSGGQSSRNHFESASVYAGLGATDFCTLPEEDIKRSTYLHLHGYRSTKGQAFHSPWISFTDSWMFVMYWALRHHLKGCTGIKIHIIDTYTIMKPALIFHSYTLVKALKVGTGFTKTWYKRMLGGTYTEFLVWNDLAVAEADVVALKDLLEAESTNAPGLHPSTKKVFKIRQVKNTDGENVNMIKAPSSLRDSLREDENARNWLNSAGRGPRTELFWRMCMRSTRTRQAKPPGWHSAMERSIMGRRIPISRNLINNALDVAFMFQPRFRLDILVSTLSLRTATYSKSDIAERLASHKEVKALAGDTTLNLTGLTSHKKIEVENQQEISISLARAIGATVNLGTSRPERKLVRIDSCSLPGQRRRVIYPPIQPMHRMQVTLSELSSPEGTTLDSVRGSNLDTESTAEKRKCCDNSCASEDVPLCTEESPYNNPRKKMKVEEPSGHPLPDKSVGHTSKLEHVIFFPIADSYSVDGVLHEGIEEYLSGAQEDASICKALAKHERMTGIGDIADEGAKMEADEENYFNDDEEWDDELQHALLPKPTVNGDEEVTELVQKGDTSLDDSSVDGGEHVEGDGV